MGQNAAVADYVQGVVERVTYHAEESGYSVLRMRVPGETELVTLVGSFATVEPGVTLRCRGQWRTHPKHGQQFAVTSSQELKPATMLGIERYLGSGLIKGIGPKTAAKIVAHFGVATLDVIEQTPERLLEVRSLGAKRVARITAAWAAQKVIKAIMLFLQSHGVTPALSAKIYKMYGQEAIEVVTANPYRLAADIYGIGFVTADTIARNVGIAPDSDFRLRAGATYLLQQAAEEGHCYLPEDALVAEMVTALALPDCPILTTRVRPLVQQMITEGDLIQEAETDRCYTPPFYHAEVALAQRLQALLRIPVPVETDRVQRWMDGYTAQQEVALSDQQRQAVELAARERVLILTGGPGTGKTFTTRTIVALWKAMGKRLALAAPTGRAAQRLAELTGHAAKTVHRLLAFDPGKMAFRFNQDTPLEIDALVVDESSMLDLFIAHALMKAIPPTAQVLFVGDIDQLPSVGPGNVLRDCITSERIPTIRLTEVFRQAATSQIVTNAHRINQGLAPRLEVMSRTPATDCLWVEEDEPLRGAEVVRHLMQTSFPRLGIDPVREVQVLCPGTRGDIGTRALNPLIQSLLNPPAEHKPQVQRGGTILRQGDRVIHLKNNYQLEVFNGDVGTIQRIDLEEQEVVVAYGERDVLYDVADLNEVGLAWALSIHKSQGSEYPVVVLPLFLQHYMLLSRNLLYTGLTRAKQQAVLIGSTKAIRIAINRTQERERYTWLAQRLRGSAGGS
ncbi:MAG: ATP-dependent RecD-like DNA helicase [Ktedonobacterales bacterium]|nr:ATP-dependent RecD-like DNA helicase [Ktedonobacterales bacterium]